MLDIKHIIDNQDQVKQCLAKKFFFWKVSII